MDLIKITIGQELADREDQVQKFLGDVLQRVNPFFANYERSWQPQMDIYENEEEIIILADVAGMRMEDINIEINGRVLKISGRRSKPPLIGNVRYHLAEITYGYFNRTFTLLASVDTENIEAIYKDGLLRLRITKTVMAQKVHKVTVINY